MMGAWLRLGDTGEAVDLGRRALSGNAADGRVAGPVAAALITAGQYAGALEVLEPVLTQQPGDLDAQWLALQALFSGFVSGKAPGVDAAGRTRLAALAETYIAANGRHAALARDWARAVDGSASSPPRK